MVSTTLKQKKFWVLFLLGLAILTTVLLAAGISRLEFLPGRPFPLVGLLQAWGQFRGTFGGGLAISATLVRFLIACVWVMLFIAIIGFIISPELRREAIKRFIRYLIYALFLYGLVSLLQPYLVQQGFLPPATPAGSGELAEAEPFPSPPDFVLNPPNWMVYGLNILILLIPLSLAWFFWRRWRNARPGPSSLEQLTHEAQEALSRLQAGQNLKDTIMRCYAEMSQILKSQRGLQRKQAMTPREFELYLAESGLGNEHIWRLTRLFEKVRYGGKAPGPREEQEAVACLQAIVQTYGKPL